MEHQKIPIVLNDSAIPEFVTRKLLSVNDLSNG